MLPSAAPSHDADPHALAAQVMASMQRHQVTPLPDHYLLWYTHCSGMVPELSAELDRIIRQQVALTPDVHQYLLNKYLHTTARHAGETVSHDAKQLLSQVISIVHEYSGEHHAYNQQLGEQVERLELRDSEPDAELLLSEIVGALRALQASGDHFSSRLDESRREIESLRQNLDRITSESKRDFLTGANNRRALDEVLVTMVEQAAQDATPLSLLMVDIDHFKQFNDRWGHQIGDEVLKTVAKALKQSVRGKDVVARYGGEEFCVLLAETPVQGAKVVAESIRKAIAGASLTRRDTKETLGQITVSIGISSYHAVGEDTVPYLLKRADDALYAAKAGGRNRVMSEA